MENNQEMGEPIYVGMNVGMTGGSEMNAGKAPTKITITLKKP